MLTQLATVKSRLALTVSDYDDLLTTAIKAVSARFDQETNRTLARTTGMTDEFSAEQTEIAVSCYPIEAVTKFELKSNETDGWSEQTGIDYLIRRQCVISLSAPINSQLSTINPPVARVAYTGGYVLPGESRVGVPPATPDLPSDLEQAAVEQVAYWFRNRDNTGLIRTWSTPATGANWFRR